jgi:hypothetical protein
MQSELRFSSIKQLSFSNTNSEGRLGNNNIHIAANTVIIYIVTHKSVAGQQL